MILTATIGMTLAIINFFDTDVKGCKRGLQEGTGQFGTLWRKKKAPRLKREHAGEMISDSCYCSSRYLFKIDIYLVEICRTLKLNIGKA